MMLYKVFLFYVAMLMGLWASAILALEVYHQRGGKVIAYTIMVLILSAMTMALESPF
jgi:uncharacterized membrane protein YpjA